MDQIQRHSYAMVWWLRALHKISTISFASEIAEFATEFDTLRELLDSGDIYPKQTEKSLQRFREIWSIEDQWKKGEQIKADLFFWAIYILHKVEIGDII